MRTNYILECLSTFPNLQDKLAAKKLEENKKLKKIEAPSTSQPSTSAPKAVEAKKLSESEINDKIFNVLEALPYLGDGFILKCLEMYNYDPIEVISAILDENLSPALGELPTDLIRVPPEPQPKQPILAYKGKKPTYKDTKDLLDDKSDLKQLKEFVLKTSSVTYDMYDDEYDDRYDDEHPVPVFKDAEDSNAYKYMENRFEGYDLVSDPSDASDDENVMNNGRKPGEFCDDPAKIRERREALRRGGSRGGASSYSRGGASGGSRGGSSGGSRGSASAGSRGGFSGGASGPSAPPGRDVVGKPKGQGQEKSVQKNRDKKNVHKSTRGNHNRKGGATFKRNTGMIPS